MKYCPKCGQAAEDGASFCINCRYEFDVEEKLLNVLSFFVPLVGLIMYFLDRKEKPIKAKAMLKSALIGWVIWFALIFVLTFVLTFGILNTVFTTLGGSGAITL